jgi:uncharacterized Fe-S cluster-containing protein
MKRTRAVKCDTCPFDTECVSRYGAKTALLYKINDTEYMYKNLFKSNRKKVQATLLYEFIPKLLKDKFTVLVIEAGEESTEITAVHLPVQTTLQSVPFIQ